MASHRHYSGLFLAELSPLLGLQLVRDTSRCSKLRVTKRFFLLRSLRWDDSACRFSVIINDTRVHDWSPRTRRFQVLLLSASLQSQARCQARRFRSVLQWHCRCLKVRVTVEPFCLLIDEQDEYCKNVRRPYGTREMISFIARISSRSFLSLPLPPLC
jgi:hypothetical protein